MRIDSTVQIPPMCWLKDQLLNRADTSRSFLAGLVSPSTNPFLGGLGKNLGGMCQQDALF